MNCPMTMTIAETAKQTNLAEYFVRRLTKDENRKFAIVKAGSKVLINLQSFISFLEVGIETTTEE